MYPHYVNVTYPIPDQRIQMPYIYNYPTFPVRHSPVAYEPWSYGGYQIPDSNNYFPPYHCSGYPLPYHPPPPLPYFHHACCPSFSQMLHHPVLPNYSMDQLHIYDYDKKPNWPCPYHLCCSREGDTKEKAPDADSFKLEKGKRVENQTNLEEDGSQFQFPIIWIPYKPEEAGEKDHAEEKTTPFESSKESVNSNVAQATTTMVGKNGLNHCKLIPVKQLDATENNKEPENELPKNSPVGRNKRSKLPPVCLRVEPFPKRKNGSGKSRSLSPPKRGKPEEFVSEGSATMGLKKDMNSAKENEQSKLAQVADDELADPKTNQAEMPCAGKEVGSSEAIEKVKRKELTEVEAAIIIQAAYRGYEVRKWEPIKKLKAIGKVREELNEVKCRIKAVEFSSSSSDKEASLLGEMIMSLLLKLDTIQGLDPVTRDMRKSTAKELVNLQEEVDSVVNNKGEDVNSPQTKTTGSEEVQVGEGEVEEMIALEETAEDHNGGVTDEGLATTSSGEKLELKEEKGVDMKMNEVKETWGEEEKVLEMMVQANDEGSSEDTTMITSSSSGLDMEMNEEKVCEGEVEALMGEADNGGASDEGLGEDTCVITSTEIELKEEEEKSSGDENVRLMMEKLVEKGKEQLEVITELSERIKMLEKKLATKKAAAKKGKGWGRAKTRPRR